MKPKMYKILYFFVKIFGSALNDNENSTSHAFMEYERRIEESKGGSHLNLSHLAGLEDLPFENLNDIKTIDLSYTELKWVPEGLIKNMRHLKKIYLNGNKSINLSGLTGYSAPKLYNNLAKNSNFIEENLDFSDFINPSNESPCTFPVLYPSESTSETNFTELELLDISETGVKEIPPAIFSMTNLDTLRLSDNPEIKEIPSEIKRLTKLKFLEIRNCNLISITNEIFNLKELETLDVSCNSIKNLPEGRNEMKDFEISRSEQGWTNLTNLKRLILHNNEITQLPEEFKELQGLRHLTLRGNEITNISVIFDLKNLIVDLKVKFDDFATVDLKEQKAKYISAKCNSERKGHFEADSEQYCFDYLSFFIDDDYDTLSYNPEQSFSITEENFSDDDSENKLFRKRNKRKSFPFFLNRRSVSNNLRRNEDEINLI